MDVQDADREDAVAVWVQHACWGKCTETLLIFTRGKACGPTCGWSFGSGACWRSSDCVGQLSEASRLPLRCEPGSTSGLVQKEKGISFCSIFHIQRASSGKKRRRLL